MGARRTLCCRERERTRDEERDEREREREDVAAVVVGYKNPQTRRPARVPPFLISAFFSLDPLHFRFFLFFCCCCCCCCCCCFLFSAVGSVMESKKEASAPPPPPPAPPSSSLVADLFGAKDAPDPSPSLFYCVFPRPSSVMGRDSSRSDIFGPSGKSNEAAQNQTQDAKNVAAVGSTSVGACPDGKSEGSEQRDRNPAYEQEKIYPCSLSSSLYYGGQDIYIGPSSLHDFDDDDKTGGEGDLNNPNAACRGNWWQGSLYY